MSLRSTMAALTGAGLLAGGQAVAADYVTIPLETSVARPADAVWSRISGFCDIGAEPGSGQLRDHLGQGRRGRRRAAHARARSMR